VTGIYTGLSNSAYFFTCWLAPSNTDRVELVRHNHGWIAVRIAEYLFQQGRAVLS